MGRAIGNKKGSWVKDIQNLSLQVQSNITISLDLELEDSYIKQRNNKNQRYTG